MTTSEFCQPGVAIGLIPLTRQFRVDSVWGNMLVAADGCVYIAAGNHETYRANAWLFRYDPKSGTMDTVADIAGHLGTRIGTAAPGESKIHTRLVQDDNQLIYFATMQGGIGHVTKWSHYTHPDQYEGGHLFAYDPRTGHLDDLGIPVRYEGIQTQELDRQRRVLYFVTWPKKLFGRYDLTTRRTEVFGPISWSPARPDGRRLYYGRDIMLAGDGRVYSINHAGNLTCFDPQAHELVDTDVTVRPDDSLRAHVTSSTGELHFVTSQGHLFSMTTPGPRVTHLGPVMPERAAYTPNLALTPDQTRLVYLGGSHASYDKRGIPLVEFDIERRRHHLIGQLHPDFFPPSCFAAAVDQAGRYLFAIHGGEPSHAYLGIHDPAAPQHTPWLVPPGTGAARTMQMERFGSFGRTKGWIVADYHRLCPGPTGPIESDRSMIHALAADEHGNVYGATSAGPGKTGYLFRATTMCESVEQLVDLGQLAPHARKVHHALVRAGDGCLYGGTLDLIETHGVEPRSAEHPQPILPADYEGARLFQFDPARNRLNDLGTPSPGQGIYCMCASPDGEVVYALTFPYADLIALHIGSGESRVVGRVYHERASGLRPDEFDLAALPVVSEHEYAENQQRLRRRRGIDQTVELDELTISRKFYVSRAIACDEAGNVYGSAGEGQLFRYDVRSDRLGLIDAYIPAVCGSNYGLISEIAIASLLRGEDGRLYGGTVQDGYVFSFDPRTGQVYNHGKPDIQGNIRALAEWRGDIYGLVGEDLGKTHLFRLERNGAGLVDLGVLQGGGHTGFPVNRCDALVVGKDDRLYIGQSERASSLLSLGDLTYEPLLPP